MNGGDHYKTGEENGVCVGGDKNKTEKRNETSFFIKINQHSLTWDSALPHRRRAGPQL